MGQFWGSWSWKQIDVGIQRWTVKFLDVCFSNCWWNLFYVGHFFLFIAVYLLTIAHKYIAHFCLIWGIYILRQSVTSLLCLRMAYDYYEFFLLEKILYLYMHEVFNLNFLMWFTYVSTYFDRKMVQKSQ